MKLKTANLVYCNGDDKIQFIYDINVTKEGLFTTTLPKEAVEKIECYGVKLGANRLGNRGYFESKTADGLVQDIKAMVAEAMSRELEYEEDVLEYQIDISASYCKNGSDPSDQTLYPNGGWVPGVRVGSYEGYDWINGNINHDSTHPNPFFLSVYVKPRTKLHYKYKSGKQSVEYAHHFDDSKYDKDGAVRFIAAIPNLAPRSRFGNSTQVKEMPCNEQNASFFKSAIMAIWNLNERLGSILREDLLEEAIQSNAMLLTDGKGGLK